VSDNVEKLFETDIYIYIYIYISNFTVINNELVNGLEGSKGKGKGKLHSCTGTDALYRPYGP
jgi:hypothetical protein